MKRGFITFYASFNERAFRTPVRLGFFQPAFGHVEYALGIRHVRGVDELGDSRAFLASAQIDAESAVVADDVAADGLCGVAEELVGLGHDLVRDVD